MEEMMSGLTVDHVKRIVISLKNIQKEEELSFCIKTITRGSDGWKNIFVDYPGTSLEESIKYACEAFRKKNSCEGVPEIAVFHVAIFDAGNNLFYISLTDENFGVKEIKKFIRECVDRYREPS